MGDLISRQNAIRWVKTNCNPYGKPTLDYESSIKIIDHLEKMQSEPQWVPCSERLPDDGTYLCWEWQGFCYVDSFKDGNWELTEKCYTKCIAWMPLPKPYKEGENG